MAQLSDDCFAFGGRLMPLAEARARLAEVTMPVAGRETVPLRWALGRYLAADLVAPVDVPPHANSAVDGYAIRFEDLTADAETRLLVVGRAAAGHPWSGALVPGTALRIFTGAPMPEGADTVMMQEDCRVDGDAVIVPPGIRRGGNRRMAGEDVARGDVVLAAGRRLRPQDVGLAAALGATGLEVFRPLRVAVFSTGDELGEPGGRLPSGAVYDSNRYTLAALVEGVGAEVEDLGILPDSPAAIRAALAEAAATCDAIITSGGMSSGEEDHVKAALEASGTLHFWRLAIKPGRPVALGQIDRVPFVGLPGNPVAAMVTFLAVARPLLQRLAGATVAEPRRYAVRAAFDYRKKSDRREFVRVTVAPDEDGTLVARKFPRDGAGILSSMVNSDGLVELPEPLTRLDAGSMVSYLPFSEVGL
jgi:molybdopterin molybdotransferase